MTTKQLPLIKLMSAKDMVKEYNYLTGKSIAKFSSRPAGETQLAKAREANPEKLAVFYIIDPAKIVKPAPKKVEYKSGYCPKCNHGPEESDQTGAGPEGTIAGDQRSFCHHCSTEYWNETGKIYKAPAVNAGRRSNAIALTWKDAQVAAKRAKRDSVTANGAPYKSVRAAFKALRLPIEKHIKFRMELKEKGEAIFTHADKPYVFKVIKQQTLAV